MSASDFNDNNLEAPENPYDTTIPILLCDNVKSVCKWYLVRLTPDFPEDFARGDIIELLDTINKDQWAICQELSSKGKLHYHLLIRSIFPADDVKKDFTEFLREKYPGKWGKADGNKRNNFQECNDVNKSFRYICKQKDVKFGEDINPDYIEWAKKMSYEKYSKQAFMVEYDKIINMFKSDDIDHKQLRTKIIQLKGKFSQPINSNRITDIVNSLRVQKDPSYAYEL